MVHWSFCFELLLGHWLRNCFLSEVQIIVVRISAATFICNCSNSTDEMSEVDRNENFEEFVCEN